MPDVPDAKRPVLRNTGAVFLYGEDLRRAGRDADGAYGVQKKRNPAKSCMGGLDPFLTRNIGSLPLNLVDAAASPPPSENDPNGISCWLKTQPISHAPGRANCVQSDLRAL